MLEKKSVLVSKDKLVNLIVILEADIPKLELDEAFQKHDPAYYNYVAYYEDLVETLLELGGKEHLSLFGAYLVGLLAYQVMELGAPLHIAVKLIIDELKYKIELLDSTKAANEKKPKNNGDGPNYDA